MTLEDVAKLFYFMTFIPKCHILATRCKKCGIFTILGNILAILEDFLTELEKKVAHDLLGHGETFFIFLLSFLSLTLKVFLTEKEKSE